MNLIRLKCLATVLILLSAARLYDCELSMLQKLEKLRQEMKNKGYSAYIIPTEDEHQSEYVSEYDQRRAWITDFTGSAGTAVVTDNEAALWTDSRYYLQAANQLDKKYWMLMKDSESETPRIEDWLKEKLKNGDIVGQNAKLTPISYWQYTENQLNKSGIIINSPNIDLIDLVWPADERPQKPNSEIKIHDIKFAGKTWAEKISMVKEKIKDNEADFYVVTALDEIAWLFNMRASDIPYNPMFFAYAIISANSDSHRMYINQDRVNQKIKDHLKGIEFKDYGDITIDIKAESDNKKKIWISPMSSYAIYNSITDKSLMVLKASPVRSLKARKNDVEIKNLRICHLRDSVARIRHMYWLETEMSKKAGVTQKSAAEKLEQIQSEDEFYAMLSFDSISAVGANAAIIHYSTLEEKDEPLEKNKIFLLDAGAQYQDCTTDVTRTHHYGTPTSKEKLAYTKVLQGSINLANIVFPYGVYGRALDVEARSALWRAGLDYGHGTGHGIGYYLSVHEDPPFTSYNSRDPYDETFVPGMIQSDEPGYYEDGLFGIRLETDLETVETKTDYSYNNRKYLKFESLTWVPFEKNLIDECLLTNEQVDWLNEYNKNIREKVGPRLANYPEIRKFMNEKTEPFKYSHAYDYCPSYLKYINKANSLNSNIFVTISMFFSILFLNF